MRARSISIRSSWPATSASRAFPTRARTWPCSPPMAWTRGRRWWTWALDGPVLPRRRPTLWAGHRRRHLTGDATAAASTRRRGGVANLRYVQAGFLSYQHPGPPADAVYSRNALHQLPDFWKAVALDRIRWMLRPGGVLRLRDLIYDFQPSEADAVFEQWLDGAADDPALGYPGRTWPSTSAPSTAPSGGCWSRYWPPPASRSSPRTLRGRYMAPTPAAGAEPSR
jgi:hypothetical protein